MAESLELLRILVVEPRGGDLGQLLRAGGADVVSVSTLDRVPPGTAPLVAVVLDADFLGEALVAVAETVRQRELAGAVVVVAGREDFEVMRRAMLAGVRELLTRPLQSAELVQAVRRAAGAAATPATLAPAVSPPSASTTAGGQVVAVFSPRGGAGCTTIAANLAAMLIQVALWRGARVALVDGRPEFGAIATALSLDAGQKLVQWPASGGELDSLLLDHWSGLQVLLPPSRGPLGDQQLPSVAVALRSRFGFVVVDLGHDLDAGAEAVLRAADHIVLVTTTDIVALLQVGHALDRLKGLGATRRTALVVNRSDERPSIAVAEVERRLGQRAAVVLPVDEALRDALDLGVPLVLRDPAGKTSQRFLALAEAVAGPLPPDARLPGVGAWPGGRGDQARAVSAAGRRALYGLAAALVFGTLLGVAALLVGLGALNGSPLNVGAGAVQSAPARPGIGTPVRDRFWEYTLVSVENVDPDARFFTRRPAGRFLALNLRLQNLSNQTGLLAEREVRLRDDRGGEYDVSSEGSLGYYLKARLTNPFATSIAPGLAVNTAFVFDVPEQSRNFVLRVRGAPFAEAVEIAFSR